ncbi:ead/Ea22-like family protein [Klebsiella quasipneumoniae]|uniref:ead/Ea22-like family protein n=1 Tax=Klebsiella quasipneumoniae TaxID=1463165 RepID=UPI00300443C4
MTDITELAHREKFEAWWERTQHNGNPPRFGWSRWRDGEGYKVDDDNSELDGMWSAWKAAGAELVEALEKAQQYAKERDEENQDLMLTIGRLRVEREGLESRTVKLSPELYTIGELIRTQDNRITDQPMFVVFQKREIIGSDEHSPSRICWVWDGEEVSELRAKRLEALYQDGRDTRGYDRYAMQEVDEFVTACFTEHGCKDYLRQNGHNLRLPYIYACGSFRNNEYQLVRNWLAGIKVEAE